MGVPLMQLGAVIASIQVTVAGVMLPPLPAPPAESVASKVPIVLVEQVKKPNYEDEVLKPFQIKRDDALAKVKADCDAQGGTTDLFKCIPPPPPPPPEPEPTPEQYGGGSAVAAPIATGTAGDYLTGSYGYALAGGNCVNEAGVNNPGAGNPISWPITSSEPWIGSSALFWFNHVAVVTGIWSNGDIEVRHQNCSGCPTRYPRSAFRGFR
jgi:hypothetical protein